MAIAQCLAAGCPPPRPGYAFFLNIPGTHHSAVIAPDASASLLRGEFVKVCHMKPPLHVRGESDLPVNAYGWLGWFNEVSDEHYEGISAETRRIGRLMLSDARLGSSYDLGPHGMDEEPQDPNDPDERTRHFRASCASFLEHCYEAVKVDLVDAAHVPVIHSEQQLATVLQQAARAVNINLRRLGVQPAWPCRILLPAYQMRAFAKPFGRLPHRPALTDHPFP